MGKGRKSHSEKKVNLKTLSESDLLENYNRRDNVKILGLKETTDGQREMMETTIKKVVDISNAIEAQISENDISIADRLPSRNAGNKPVIVRFARRIKKIDLLKKKKNLVNHEDLRDIKIFEDLSAARVNFLKIMRSDERIQSTWTREGTIFFIWKADEKLYKKINGLYEGGQFLDYKLDVVRNCFNGVFRSSAGQMGS